MVGSWAKICAEPTRRAAAAVLAAAAAMFYFLTRSAHAADPIKVGFSMSLTGAVAQNGKQLLMALQIWRDDRQCQGRAARPSGRARLLRRPEQSVERARASTPS